ncbi:hypothetical protein KSP39_PZI014759 [Platanthera zijinensis]|uniref:Uncharacterized protein n=1 Tax=Platanthera zijinensis TaxID=2320716 RepID=A0AAP0BCL4_9ASPA
MLFLGSSYVVLGQFKTYVILLGGFLLFDSNPGILSICGAITAVGGMSTYTYLHMLCWNFIIFINIFIHLLIPNCTAV